MRSTRTRRVVVFASIVCAAGFLATGSSQERPSTPTDSGLVERTGIAIQLLDVEVVDRHGNPRPGLTADDFAVWMDGRRAEIYSVDDLCDCEPPRADATAAESPRDAPDADATAIAVDRERRGAFERFVLYFDFSQLQPDGREVAFREAKQWVQRITSVGAAAMIVGYHSTSGIHILQEFTGDPDLLNKALEAARVSNELVDPFPGFFSTRLESCTRCCRATFCELGCEYCCPFECVGNPRREYEHGKRSYGGLTRLLQNLEEVPGRKALILFHQNLMTYPGRYYGVSDFRVGDLTRTLERVGAEATLSRVAVFSAFVGTEESRWGPGDQAINVGANLSDFTGGRYNRGATTLPALQDFAIRECACTYRIALRERGPSRDKVHRVIVEAGGERVPFSYRVQFLDETDRWWRKARNVLADPVAATDVTAHAAIVPLRRDRKGWEVEAMVAVDVGSLMLAPEHEGQQGGWEVGALLHNEQTGKAWEMLGVSRAHVKGEGATDAEVIHRRSVSGVKGGAYRLAAFVRDKYANAFGGGVAELELPEAGHAGIAGPIIMTAGRPRLFTTLPPLTKKAVAPLRTADPEQRPFPAPSTDFTRGETILLVSWICGNKGDTDLGSGVRFVSGDDGPLFRFEESNTASAGDCIRVTDPVETAFLEEGSYTYHCRWHAGSGGAPLERSIGFSVREELVGRAGESP